MANLSDKELDRLSRDAAERFDVDEDIGNWDRLAQGLDRELGNAPPSSKVPGAPRSPFLFAPAIVVLLGITYYLLKPNTHRSTSTLPVQSEIRKDNVQEQQPADLTQQNRDSEKNKDLKNPDAEPLAEKTDQSVSAVKQPPAENAVKNSSATTKPPAEKNTETPENKSISDATVKNRGGKETGTEKARAAGSAGNNTRKPGEFLNGQEKKKSDLLVSRKKKDAPAGTEEGITAASSIRGESRTAGKKSSKKQSVSFTDHLASVKTGTVKTRESKGLKNPKEKLAVSAGSISLEEQGPYYANLPMLLPDLREEEKIDDSALRAYLPPPSPKAEPQKKKSLHINRSLQVGILFAPDFSNVRFEYADKAGTNFGITLGYYLTKNLSVNTGVIFARKNYSALGRDFHPPKNPWQYDDVEFLKGNCRMIEIPLNMRFDFTGSATTKGFISAGLSSYLMNNENYRLYFHRFGLVTTREISNNMQQNYLFSVLNLSSGFETNISNSFSFEIEPFLKLPLSGIGYGNISLSSYGVNFYLKFAPVLSRKKH